MSSVVSTRVNKSFEKGPVRRSLFRNGAVTLFHQFKGMESARLNIYFLAGSIFEGPKQEGLAHVIEHMLFKEERSSNIVQRMESQGAQINAYTYKEHVCFELDCAAGMLPQFLSDFLSLILSPVFLPNDLALEKKVILQELREDRDDHETEGIEYLYAKNFKRDLGHPIGGSIGQVKSYNAADLLAYHKKHYRPERMVISATSGRAFAGFEDCVAKAFAASGLVKSARPFRLKPKNSFSRLNHVKRRLKRPMESSILLYSFDGPSVCHRDYYNFLVLDEILFGGMSSLFFTELREKNAYVYGLGSALNVYSSAGNYMMLFHTLKSNIPKTRERVEAVLRQLEANSAPESEIEAIKKRIVLGWRLSFDDILERNEYLAEMELLGEDDFSLSRQKQNLDLVTSKSLQSLVKKILSREHSLLTMSS